MSPIEHWNLETRIAMPKKLSQISPEQAARFGEWAKKWVEVGLSTAPADFDAATDAALKAYDLCNIGRPKIVLRMGSPYGATLGGALAWGFLRALKDPQVGSQVGSQVRSQVRSQVWSQVESQVWSQVWSQVESQVGSQVWSQVRSQVRSQVWSQVGSQVWSQVESQVWSQVESQVWSQVGSQVRSQVRSQVESQVWSQVWSQVGSQVGDSVYNYRGGAFWASWCAYVSYMRDVLGWEDPALERFAIDEALTRSCGWVWWHENILAISDRPSEIHRDDRGRLHNLSGPSIAYRDGWALHHVHGVSVPADIIEDPKSITVARIEKEQNAEVRRVMVERYGAGRYLLDSGAQEVARDVYGTLYRKELPGDEDMVMVRVLNSTPEPDGSTREYWLRVHPELRPLMAGGKLGEPQKPTAHNAVASSFGLRGEEYGPRCET